MNHLATLGPAACRSLSNHCAETLIDIAKWFADAVERCPPGIGTRSMAQIRRLLETEGVIRDWEYGEFLKMDEDQTLFPIALSRASSASKEAVRWLGFDDWMQVANDIERIRLHAAQFAISAQVMNEIDAIAVTLSMKDWK